MINENLIKFQALIEEKREELEAERLTMTEVAFGKKYKVSPKRIVECLWVVPFKEIFSKKVILDKAVVLALRLEWMSDVMIAAKFKTSNQDVRKQCWGRSENGIRRWGKSPEWLLAEKYIRTDINTTAWERPKEWWESWRTEWELIEQWQRPISILKDFQKWW